MRAMVLREQGSAARPVLENGFPDPVAGEGDVIVRVRATSLNYHDVFTTRGMPGIKIPLPMGGIVATGGCGTPEIVRKAV